MSLPAGRFLQGRVAECLAAALPSSNFAYERLLYQLQKGTRLLNVDESWVSYGDGRSMKWRV